MSDIFEPIPYFDEPLCSSPYFSHHGVKGMKWGVRHDRERSGMSRVQRKAEKKKERTAKAAERIRNSGGSKLKAGAKVYGKSMAKQIGTVTVASLTASATNNNKVKIGIGTVSAMIQIKQGVDSYRDMYDIYKYGKK